MQFIHTMEYYSAVEKNKNKVMNLAGKWAELETVILSEATQMKT